ncbi:hypothetical protein [Aliiroseovarius sp. F20344]|uniref:hypothetical protein n=1 Tax=Aliiroseovarius sp. F20344 TaxID=2926414 RepID=UPI001FF10942|nr:hypothetical protein [Aliiroseovarius sp. F20344]MCK0141573.1 hypothetical protein [Aliiroseovarius sp. F20344]
MKREFEKANKIAFKLVGKYPNAVVCNLHLAETTLFMGDTEQAKLRYEKTRQLLESNTQLSKENRRFFAAVINFRMMAIEYKTAGHVWAKAGGFAKAINELEADALAKRLFLLPE